MKLGCGGCRPKTVIRNAIAEIAFWVVLQSAIRSLSSDT